MRLVGVEIRRLLARTLVTLSLVAGVLAVGLSLFSAYQATTPPSAEQVAFAQELYEDSRADWEENHEQWLADCLRDQEAQREQLDDPDMDLGCTVPEPTLQDFLMTTPELSLALPGAQMNVVLVVAFILLAIGATSTAAEMSTGAISTWLTFVPQRFRVLAAKVAAPTVVAVPAAALLLGLHLGGLFAVYAHRDHAGGMDAQAWGDALALLGRGTGVAALAAATGACLGVLLKHTGVVLGVLAAYALVFEGMLAYQLGRLKVALLSVNLQAVVNDGSTYGVDECHVSAGGMYCESVDHAVPLWQGALVLGLLTAVVFGVTALVFRRRDVG